jgi:hypothetical protein
VAGPDGVPLGNAVAANVLGGAQRFTIHFDSTTGTPREVIVRDFTFRRVDSP